MISTMTDTKGPPDSVAPALLLSMPQLRDPNFTRSVVLLCQYGPDGAWGLVLNHPTGKPAAMVVRFDPPLIRDSGIELWMGGPVEPERGCMLLGDEPPEGEALRIRDGLYLSGSPAILRRLLEGPPPSRCRLFMGYAGWGPGQLDAELTQSAWLITDVDLDIIFETDPALMWEKAIRRLGADPATLQMSSGVH
jgi:putative transcriptional regulator